MSTIPSFILIFLLLVWSTELSKSAGIDDWSGRWQVKTTYQGKDSSFEFDLIPHAANFAIQGTTTKAELIALTENGIAFELAGTEKISFQANRPGTGAAQFQRFSGSTWHPTAGEGTFTATILHQFAGFFIAAPTRVKWGSTLTLQLQYAKAGQRRKWLGEAKWTIKAPVKGLLTGDQRQSTRIIQLPDAPSEFAEMTIELTANGLGNPTLSKNLNKAKLTIVVTSVPDDCKLLSRKITDKQKALNHLVDSRQGKEVKLAATKFPNPQDPATALALNAAIGEINQRLAKLRQDETSMLKLSQGLFQAENKLRGFRTDLRGLTNENGIAFYSLDWYKNSKGPIQDRKADFIRLYLGTEPLAKSIDAEFASAYLQAQRKGVAVVGVGLVQIGGLVTLMVPGAGGSGSGIANSVKHVLEGMLSFVPSTYAEQKLKSAGILQGLKSSESAILGFVNGADELALLAQKHAATTDKDEQAKLVVELNRAGLQAMVRAIEAERKIRKARPIAKRGLGTIQGEIINQRRLLNQLKSRLAQGKKSGDAQSLEVSKIELLREALKREIDTFQSMEQELEKTLTRLRTHHQKHCLGLRIDDWDIPLDDCCTRRGELVAESFFSGGTDDWKVIGDAKEFKAVLNHIQAKDKGDNIYWHFDAPEKFVLPGIRLYGGSLTFQLKQIANGDKRFGSRLVVLSDGKRILYYAQNPAPLAEDWTSFEVCLHPSAKGWASKEGPVTEEVFKEVLTNLKYLRINCEHTSKHETGGLRNVVLYAGP